MTWFLIALAEVWRWRWKVGLPVLLGAVWGAAQVLVYPEVYQARALLQLQSEQAREPLLQKITARGHKEALYQKLTAPDVLADSGREAGMPLRAENVDLVVFNDHFMGISYKSTKREGLEQAVDSLGFNFIQQVLAPERSRIEQMLNVAKQQMVDVLVQISDLNKAANGGDSRQNAADDAADDGENAATEVQGAAIGAREELELKRKQLETDIVQLQTDLQLVNTAFDRDGSQALLWFAQPATLMPVTPRVARLALWMLWGGMVGFAAGWLVFVMPRRWRQGVVGARDVQQACGLPLLGQLPWLGRLKIDHGGAHVKAQGRVLRPSGFGEVGRLQATLLKTVRGPLVLVGANGLEGVSTLALLLGEKAATLGKSVVVVDLNLKNRGLTHMLGLRGDDWEMPKKGKAKGPEWSALQPISGVEHLKVLPAPTKGSTLAALGEPGGLAALMDALGEMADVVIVDASPVGATNRANVDAVAVGGVAGKVVLVGQSSLTTPGDLRHAADTLLLSGAALSGVVLNQQFEPSRRQLVGEFADWLGPLGRPLRRAAADAKLE
ncbi:MAG: hypothetical protein GC129_00135 [Proteobacteria bacterium]|nr:hypothetical protein [Pseudomonadota bacterium]